MPLFKKPKKQAETPAQKRCKLIEDLGALRDELESKRRWQDTFIGKEKEQFEQSLVLISDSRRIFDSMLSFRTSIAEADFYAFVNTKIDEIKKLVKKIGPSTYPISDVYTLAKALYDYVEKTAKS